MTNLVSSVDEDDIIFNSNNLSNLDEISLFKDENTICIEGRDGENPPVIIELSESEAVQLSEWLQSAISRFES